ncbi:MAG: anion permease [Ignavibacteriaceae bacterium]|nr:anion permease [Ignavibacteriaceae bacterium]
MDKVQIVCFFITGFIVSRIIVKSRLPEVIINYLISDRHLHLRSIIFIVTAFAAVLSFLIPNVIAVLTILPLAQKLAEIYPADEKTKIKISTALALSIIYGANIGGMGSLTGTPANGIMLSFMTLNSVAGTDKITFSTWFIWGVPVVFMMTAVAWSVIILVFGLINGDSKLKVTLPPSGHSDSYVRKTVILTIFYMLSSFLLSAVMIGYTAYSVQLTVLILTIVITTGYLVYLFLMKSDNENKKPMLAIRDCYSGLPMKGFLFVGISIALGGIFILFDAKGFMSDFLKDYLPAGAPGITLLLIFALITTFATELISNTAVQIAMFLLLGSFGSDNEYLFLGYLIVTYSSTSAFMSPIATGVNGLAFGGMGKVSLRKMLTAGFLMNISGALIITLWLKLVIHWLFF